MTGNVRYIGFLPPVLRWILLSAAVLALGLGGPRPSIGAEDESLQDGSKIPSARVLIIHSSHKGYPWTDSIDRGIAETLGAAPEIIEIRTEYLDTARKRYDRALYFEEFYQLWLTKYQDSQFDVIFTSDNDAFDFIVTYRRALFGETPVVFSGLNNFSPAMLAGEQGITGVVENDDFVETIDLALKLHPRAREVVIVVPGSAAFRMKMVEDLPAIYGPKIAVSYVEEALISEVEKKVKALSSDVIVIPIASAETEHGEVIDFPEFVEQISGWSKAPVYSVWDLALGHGIVGGKLTSGLAQGETAASLALKIIRGQDIDEVPVVAEASNRYMFDDTQLRRFGIQESDLPAESVVINRPLSFYSRHTVLVWSVSAVVLGLICLVGLLSVAVVWSWRLRRKSAAADEALRQSHLRLVHLVENLPAGAVHLDGAGIRMNRAAEIITGYDRLEMSTLEMFLQNLFGDRWQEIKDLYESDRKAGYPESREIPIHHKDGRERLVQFFGYASGEQSVWLLNDVTESRSAQRELEISRARLQSIIETAPDAIITIDSQGSIASFSFAAERIFGYQASEIIGKNVKVLMPEPYKQEHDSYLARYRMTGEKRIIGIGREVEAVKKDGTVLPVDLSVGEVSLESGDHIFVGIIRDVTERREAQSHIDHLQEDLLHVSRIAEISELTTDLAHEINQPLGAVKNYVEASRDLLTDPAAVASGKVSELMGKAVAQADRASATVRRLRSFIERGEISRRPERVADIVEEAWGLARLGAERRNVRVLFDISPDLPEVFVDRLQIQQVVLNLMRNAQDAVSDSPQREIQVSGKRRDAGGVEVAVSDTGPGIAAEVAERLFHPFVTTKANGVGIGLSISRSIIEAHGGRLWADAGRAEGAVFRFTLEEARGQGGGRQ